MTDPWTKVQQLFWHDLDRILLMTKAVCAFCGKSVVRAALWSEVEVREGEKLFHLDCYLPYKRQARQSLPSAALSSARA